MPPLPANTESVWLKHENGRAVLAFGASDPEDDLQRSRELAAPASLQLRIVSLSRQFARKNEPLAAGTVKRRDFLPNLDDPCLDALCAPEGEEARTWPSTDRIVLQVKRTTDTDALVSRLTTIANLGIPVATLSDPRMFETRPELLDGYVAFAPVVLSATSGLLHRNPQCLAESFLTVIREIRITNPSAQIEVRIPPAHLRLSNFAFQSRFEFMAELLTGLLDLPGDLPGLGPLVPFLDAILHGCVTSQWEDSVPVVSRSGECNEEDCEKRRDEFRKDRELFHEFANEELDALLPIPRLHANHHTLPRLVLQDRMSRLLELYRAVQGELIHELSQYYGANIQEHSRPYVLHFGEGMTPNYTVLSEEKYHVDHA